MVTSEERLKILKMIQEGKLSADEAAQLIEALEGAGEMGRQDYKLEGTSGGKTGGRWVHVRVTDTNTGKARVNIRLPVGLVSAGIKMGARFAPEVQGLDTDRLMDVINAGEVGQVVDVVDDTDGEHVEVFVE